MKRRTAAACVGVICALDLIGPPGARAQASAAGAGGAPSSPLRFVLGPAPRWLTARHLVVHYELVNGGDAGVYVSQFPGPGVVATCETESGGIGGAPGGAWSKDGTLARKYYLQLAAGEALMGETVVMVPSECRRNLRLLGVFQMEDGDDWGLAVPGRRIEADPLPVPIEGRPREAIRRPTSSRR